MAEAYLARRRALGGVRTEYGWNPRPGSL